MRLGYVTAILPDWTLEQHMQFAARNGFDSLEVMCWPVGKAEILDPQGQAIVGALSRLGFAGVSDVRQGKRFELEIDGSVEDAELEKIAEGLLANTVIEDWTVRRVEA